MLHLNIVHLKCSENLQFIVQVFHWHMILNYNYVNTYLKVNQNACKPTQLWECHQFTKIFLSYLNIVFLQLLLMFSNLDLLHNMYAIFLL